VRDVRQVADYRAESPRFGELFRRLVSEIRNLIDQRLTLLRIELKEHLAAAARDVLLIAVGMGLMIIALLFLLGGLALGLGKAIGSTAGGFALVGAIALIAGGVLAGAGAMELKRRRLAPKTREELRRDVEWINTRI
jgi:uncharacterized membrane protein YqjE